MSSNRAPFCSFVSPTHKSVNQSICILFPPPFPTCITSKSAYNFPSHSVCMETSACCMFSTPYFSLKHSVNERERNKKFWWKKVSKNKRRYNMRKKPFLKRRRKEVISGRIRFFQHVHHDLLLLPLLSFFSRKTLYFDWKMNGWVTKVIFHLISHSKSPRKRLKITCEWNFYTLNEQNLLPGWIRQPEGRKEEGRKRSREEESKEGRKGRQSWKVEGCWWVSEQI